MHSESKLLTTCNITAFDIHYVGNEGKIRQLVSQLDLKTIYSLRALSYSLHVIIRASANSCRTFLRLAILGFSLEAICLNNSRQVFTPLELVLGSGGSHLSSIHHHSTAVPFRQEIQLPARGRILFTAHFSSPCTQAEKHTYLKKCVRNHLSSATSKHIEIFGSNLNCGNIWPQNFTL